MQKTRFMSASDARRHRFAHRAIAFWIVARFLPFVPQAAASTLEWLSFDYHYDNMLRGVIDSRDIIYFLSVIGIALVVTKVSLESRKWK